MKRSYIAILALLSLICVLPAGQVYASSMVVESEEEDQIEQGVVFSAEFGATGVTSGTSVLIGFVTGTRPMIALDRSYSSSESLLTVELFEATFTGGTDIRTLNRNLVIGGTPPVQFKSGVTATLVTPITTATFRAGVSTGAAAVAVTSEAARLILKPSTSYVLRITNGGAGAATIGAGFTYRNLRVDE